MAVLHCRVLNDDGEQFLTKYQIDGETVFDTDMASGHWEEGIESRVIGSEWNRQQLYKSRAGRDFLVSSSQRQNQQPRVEWLSPREAARWLVYNNHELPEDLRRLEDEFFG